MSPLLHIQQIFCEGNIDWDNLSDDILLERVRQLVLLLLSINVSENENIFFSNS